MQSVRAGSRSGPSPDCAISVLTGPQGGTHVSDQIRSLNLAESSSEWESVYEGPRGSRGQIRMISRSRFGRELDERTSSSAEWELRERLSDQEDQLGYPLQMVCGER